MIKNKLSPNRGKIVSFILIIFFLALSQAYGADSKPFEIKLGGSELINTEMPFKRVTIADPKIADVVILSPKEVYVYGKKLGYTSIILWEAGKTKTLLDVYVTLDLTGLKEKFYKLFPEQKIEVSGSENGIILSGTVTGPEIAEQAVRLAQSYLPKEATKDQTSTGGTGRSGIGVTDLLKVDGIQQVMLEVKVAEVSRESSRDLQAAIGISSLGNDFTGNFSSSALGNVSSITGGITQSAGSLLLNFAGNTPNIFVNIADFTAALKFLEGENLAKLLAEPRLVTQSGHEAKFLAGGEFPIPVPGGSGNNNSITIEYKEFGVALAFTPVVMSDGKISLKVAPSVSEIASTSLIPSGIIGSNYVVPNLNMRKLDTTVQLFDGQTLALAGLLQDNLREVVSKIPGLGDIPIIGALFKSSSYQHNKTDLIIAVTPHLIKPVQSASVKLPGEHMIPPDRFEFYLEGKLEGGSCAKEGDLRKGLEGSFGHEAVIVPVKK